MRRQVWAGLAIALALAACDGPSDIDAGTDSGVSGTDAGADSGGAIDAGPPPDAGVDSGIPESTHTAAMETESELTDVTVALADVPPAELASSTFVNLEAAMAGIDHIIGETGIQTLSYESGHRALADLEMVSRLLSLLGTTIDELAVVVDPSVQLVHTETVQLRDALRVYQAELVDLYNQRFGSEIAPVFPRTYPQHQRIFALGVDPTMGFVAENDTLAPDGTALLEWGCSATPPNGMAVIDDDTGAGNLYNLIPAEIPLDLTRETFPLRITAVGLPPGAAPALESCDVTLTSFRLVSDEPIPLSGVEIVTTAMEYQAALEAFLVQFFNAGAPPMAMALVRQVGMLSDVLAPLLAILAGPGPTVAPDDLYRLSRLYVYAAQMLATLTLNDQLAAFPDLLLAADDVQGAGANLEAAIETL
jgi:hypothetical protein